MDISELLNTGYKENKTGVYNYKGKKIILIDLNGVQPDGIKSRVDFAKRIIFISEQNSVLLLTDFRDMKYDRERTDYAIQVSKDIKPFIKKSALLGVDGMKKIVFNSMLFITKRKNMRPFSDAQEALEWLVR